MGPPLDFGLDFRIGHRGQPYYSKMRGNSNELDVAQIDDFLVCHFKFGDTDY